MGFNVLWRIYTHERSLSESSRSYMLAYYLSVFILLPTVLSTFSTYQPRFKFSSTGPWANSIDKILNTNEMLTCTNDLTRLTNAHEYRAATTR